jgi:pimeloyl-ACP methyl ester carboxylesterase
LCHGFPQAVGGAAVVGSTLPTLSQRIADALGWVVLSFSFRGCGASEGDFSLAGWLEDIGAATHELRRQPDVVGTWLTGFGTGGGLAVCAAADDPAVLGVATMAAPADFDDWASHPRRLREFSREVGAITTPGFPTRLEVWSAELRAIRAVTCAETLAPRPLMVVHGSDDQNVPVLDARILADAHGAAELRIVTGASHDLHLDPRAVAVLIGWLDRQWGRHQAASGG